VAEGLEFMARRQGPYLFHCTEGKDRTGFVAALLEALMGATKDQIVADYMQSYVDFYGVKQGTEQYRLISQDVLDMLKIIGGTPDLDTADLAAGARSYLLAGGMSPAQIDELEAKLAKPFALLLHAGSKGGSPVEPVMAGPALRGAPVALRDGPALRNGPAALCGAPAALAS
jgi:hypothetical protein